MKCKFSIQERNHLKTILESPRLGGGASLGQIKTMLSLVDKLEYKGDKEDAMIMTELTLEDSEVKKLHEIANNFAGWPVKPWVADLHERLEKYKKEAA